ncbi:hypothetical protein GALMADRAFT_1075570 [Galerina marginata CBS 339.88]|uniref:Uncharacterized protein n=1 Tax=Galerina marginata (strain CBS 339.88) TaxID=685588 RepID=A0A067SA47_GALM3|nr:hypothetical protein GALMADRAFT_1075570 [Galerina marginata CBS 339.88]
MLQSANQVGISGGNFNTVGTNQINFTINLGDENAANNLTQSVPHHERDSRPDWSTPGNETTTSDVQVDRQTPAAPPRNDPDPTPRRSYDIYYQHIGSKGRGSALWIPEPSRGLPIGYRRKGTSIGDVGIITEYGGFDFLFNIYLGPDNPINPPDLPENFTALSISSIDIDQYSEFTGESYLSSASVRKSLHEGDPSGLVFETTASEGAILTMPVGSNSQDLRHKSAIRTYIATHAQSWYKYANDVRGREARNGDIRVVVGFDKTTAWGMATFSNSTAQNDLFRLKFRPTGPDNTPRTYSWEYSGFAEARAGPDVRQIAALREGDTSQAEMEYENQTLFIRTMNVSLQADIWKALGFDFGVDVDVSSKSSTSSAGSSSLLSPREHHDVQPPQTSFPFSDKRVHRASSADTNARTPEAIVTSTLPASLTGHPSKCINEMMLQFYPNAKIAITEDNDWIYALRRVRRSIPFSNLRNVLI